jgi:hypothetical protein
VIHPFAMTLAGPITGETEQLVIADVKLDDLKDVKMWVDTTGHYSRPDVLQLLFNRAEQPTMISDAEGQR